MECDQNFHRYDHNRKRQLTSVVLYSLSTKENQSQILQGHLKAEPTNTCADVVTDTIPSILFRIHVHTFFLTLVYLFSAPTRVHECIGGAAEATVDPICLESVCEASAHQ